VPDIGPVPKEELDPCDCKKKTKDKDKKKRKPRTVCYRGTYKQTAGRTIFTPKEEIPCDAVKPRVKKQPGTSLAPTGGKSLWDQLDYYTDTGKLVDAGVDVFMKRFGKQKPKQKKIRDRKPKSKVPRLPGTIYTTPFPTEQGY